MGKLGTLHAVHHDRVKAAEAILAGKADSAIAAVLSAARTAGWTFSGRTTKGNE